MELITILNRCHRFRGFVDQHAHFSADKKSIEVAVRPRKGSAAVCSRSARGAIARDFAGPGRYCSSRAEKVLARGRADLRTTMPEPHRESLVGGIPSGIPSPPNLPRNA